MSPEAKALVARMLDELDAETSHLGEIERAIMEETQHDKTGGEDTRCKRRSVCRRDQ
jgi:cytochrome c-type biogenesis protein CcmH/NrfG